MSKRLLKTRDEIAPRLQKELSDFLYDCQFSADLYSLAANLLENALDDPHALKKAIRSSVFRAAWKRMFTEGEPVKRPITITSIDRQTRAVKDYASVLECTPDYLDVGQWDAITPQSRKKLDGVPGVYALMDGPAVQYIGTTGDLAKRLYAHARDPGKHFSNVRVKPIPDARDRAVVETILIAVLNPPYNKTIQEDKDEQ